MARRRPASAHPLLHIDGRLVSAELFEACFVCDLERCKGACCVEGDIGAPLEREELPVLEAELEAVRPFLNARGLEALDEQGPWVRDITGGYSTPLVQGRECAYAVFDARGIASCGIERAHQAGATAFRKPVSCHLYPIRIENFRGLELLAYNQWHICSPACALGASLGVRVYEFLKEAIIRKYGEAFYAELDAVAQDYAGRPSGTSPSSPE
ncbi:MAG: DUF3109 family protein [Bacteroidia bacterium]|nr:DUF3109 family protein [Bacteroidia bacterium]